MTSGIFDAITAAETELDAKVEVHRRAQGVPSGESTAEELAFQAAAVTDTNTNVLFTLGQLAREFPELQPSLQAELDARGLALPARPPSRAPAAM